MDDTKRLVYAQDAQDIRAKERSTASEHINLFKNSLIYTLTYTIVNDYIASGRGSVFTLAMCIGICVIICHLLSIQWSEATKVVEKRRRNGTPHYALPMYALVNECMDTAKNLLIQLEATLLARYAQIILQDAKSDIWVFTLSIVGIALWWILTVSLTKSGVRFNLL
jgi:hypothetical protein